MDTVLSEFIARTNAEAGLAQDVLAAHHWDLETSLGYYHTLKGCLPPPTLTKSTTLPTGSLPKLVVNMGDSSPAPKKLNRGLSSATENANIINKVRQEFGPEEEQLLLDVPNYTFSLPDLTVYPDDFQQFLKKDLIECSTLCSLESSGRLNWWFESNLCQRLWPLATSGDGNCLLHAASLGVWGFHDRLLKLRKALHSLMTSKTFEPLFYRRWRFETLLQNIQSGLVYTEVEWQQEWEALLKMASSEPRSKPSRRHSYVDLSSKRSSLPDNALYEGLEEIHIFALAHVLRRPILVIAETVLLDHSGEPFAPITLGGVYLPIECPPHECHRSPLCLAYDAAHFSALVTMKQNSKLPAAIPLVDSSQNLLPVHFAVDPGSQYNWDHSDPLQLDLSLFDQMELLKEYLDVLDFSCNSSGCPTPVNEMVDDISDSSMCGLVPNQKSRAAKQLQTVVRQVGSLGKNMGKKLKHITRRSNSFKEGLGIDPLSSKAKSKSLEGNFSQLSNGTHSPPPPQLLQKSFTACLLIALLHSEKQHQYQEELITNYLESAMKRFQNSPPSGGSSKSSSEAMTVCINTDCKGLANSKTSYLCTKCYGTQHKEEIKVLDGVIKSGKSSFYTETDMGMMASLAHVPVGVRPRGDNATLSQNNLIMSKSVFYDTLSSSANI